MDDERFLGAKPSFLPASRRGLTVPGVPQDAWDAGELRNLIELLQRHANPGRERDPHKGALAAQLSARFAPQPGELEAFNHMQNLREQEAEFLERRANTDPFRGLSGVLDGPLTEALRQQLPKGKRR